jgi:hypothetical protein
MIKKITAWVVICDGCRGEYVRCGDIKYSLFRTKREAFEDATDFFGTDSFFFGEWVARTRSRKIYCPDCWRKMQSKMNGGKKRKV